MNIMRNRVTVKPERWARYKYNLTTPMGEGGKRLTGCQEHIDLSRKIATEGMVLLENDGTLPLKKGSRLALFGMGSIDYVKGGFGSGDVYSAYVRNLYEGFVLKEPYVSVYEPLSKFYYDYMVEHIEEHEEKLFEELEIPQDLLLDAAQNADTAILVIYRQSGEMYDRSEEAGDFLLTEMEQKLVEDVTTHFEKVVAVLDIGGIIDVSWIKENDNIGAALLAWQAGMEGGLAIADILCGDVNPSGKLVDTFTKKFTDYPSSATFNESEDYVDYFEDIYVGYRYFETIPGAAQKVEYPFGYGLSYTQFEISKPIAALSGDKIQVRVTVKNVGDVAGKEVVQCYFSAPQGKLGKSAISLAAFEKTKLLASGETQDITLEFAVSDMASYDDLGKCQKSAYILEGGEYLFFVGNSCRNLTKADYKYIVTEEFVVTQQFSQKCAPNKIEKRLLADGTYEVVPSFELIEYDIPEPVSGAKAPESEEVIPFKDVAAGKITLDEFIAQMTDDELIQMMGGVPFRGIPGAAGMGGITRLGIPAFMTTDGPAGIHLTAKAGIATTAFPCATLIACTWDPNLLYEMGKAGAREGKENGLAIWLAPAMNIHRTPLCGRNFEYYSEDPLIAGKFGSAMVRGMQSENTACSVKHFACNNKETNRNFSDSRMSERALREIYLKGFEICVKEANPWTIMTSYNVLNGQRPCESYELLQGVLRDEWGYKGMVTSDWYVVCDQKKCVKAGNDIRMPEGNLEQLRKDLENGDLKRGHLEVCVKRILELFLKFE